MTDMTRMLDALEFARNFFEARAQMATPGSEGAGKLYECAKGCADAMALLKAQEPVKPMLKNGWYWCGGIGCRNSLTSVIDNDVPALKPNYCGQCGRAVKWE